MQRKLKKRDIQNKMVFNFSMHVSICIFVCDFVYSFICTIFLWTKKGLGNSIKRCTKEQISGHGECFLYILRLRSFIHENLHHLLRPFQFHLNSFGPIWMTTIPESTDKPTYCPPVQLSPSCTSSHTPLQLHFQPPGISPPVAVFFNGIVPIVSWVCLRRWKS